MLFKNFNDDQFTNEMNASIQGDNNVIDNDMNIDVNLTGNGMSRDCGMMMPNCQEPVQQRCVHRTFVHEIPHTCRVHTTVVNHHVYKHTYRPEFTCSEQNVVSNVQCGSCANICPNPCPNNCPNCR